MSAPITEAVASALDKLRRGLSYDPGTYRGVPEERRIRELTVEEAAAVLAEVERLKSSATAGALRIAELERWYMQAGDRIQELERRYEPDRDRWQPANNAATAPGVRP